MKTIPTKKVLTLSIALTIACLFLVAGCPSVKTETRIPSPKIVGEWKPEGKESEIGFRAATTGKIDGKDYLFLSAVESPSKWAIQILDINNPENPTIVGQLKKTSEMEPIGIKLLDKTLFALAMDSLHIIDVSNPSLPIEVLKLSTGDAFNRPIAISGDYIYLGSLYSIVIIDISNQANPIKKDTLKIPSRALRALTAYDFLLLAVALDGVYIYDISSPGSLKEIGFFANPNKVDATDHWPQDWLFDVAIAGKYAYIASGKSGLRVIDLSNPASPKEIGNLKTQGVAARVIISENLAYIIDWRKSLLSEYPLTMMIADISDPQKPKEISSVELPAYLNFNFNYDLAKEHVYYFGDSPSIKIINIYAKEK